MQTSYRLGLRASYGRKLIGACMVLGGMGSSAGCAFAPSVAPPAIRVAASLPSDWPSPPGAPADGDPKIVAARFSSLDVPVGHTWDGDVVASSNVRRIDLFTNLWDIVAKPVAPGRFHFSVEVYDLPAFLVRPYALNIIARSANGRRTTLVVPFRIAGRPVAGT